MYFCVLPFVSICMCVCVLCRYDPVRAEKEETLSLFDIEELLGLPLVGVIPESSTVLTSTNLGQPIISMEDKAGFAYLDAVERYGLENTWMLSILEGQCL